MQLHVHMSSINLLIHRDAPHKLYSLTGTITLFNCERALPEINFLYQLS